MKKNTSTDDANALFKEMLVLRELINGDGIPMKYIKEHTGISWYYLNKILISCDEIEVKNNYDKFKDLTERLRRFYNTEKYNFAITLNYHKMPWEEFENVFNTLYDELKLNNKTALCDEAERWLKEWYDTFKEKPFAISSDGTLEQLPESLAFYNFILDNTSSEKHEELITALSLDAEIRRRIDQLENEIYYEEARLTDGAYYCEEDEDEVYSEGYFELSDEMKEQTKKRIDESKAELQRLYDSLKKIKGIEEIEELKSQYSIFVRSGYDISSRIEKSLSGLHSHNLTHSKFSVLTTDQQRALLNVMLDKCFDDNGFLLPDHFGTAMYLMDLNVDHSLLSFDRFTQKENHKLEYKLPEIEEIEDSEAINDFIDRHSRVLLKRQFNEQIRSVCHELSDASRCVSDEIFLFIKKKMYLEKFGNENQSEYYKTISEYSNLVSETEPIGEKHTYSREQLYRLVYEKCQSSDGKYSFSLDAVIDLQRKLLYTAKDWLWEMFLFSYCTRYKSVKRLILHIRKLKEKERELENDRELEQDNMDI